MENRRATLTLEPVSNTTLEEVVTLMSEYYEILNRGLFKHAKYTSNIDRLKTLVQEAMSGGVMYFAILSQDERIKGVAVVDVREKKEKKKGWIYLLYIKNGTAEEYRRILQELIMFLKNQGATQIETETAEHAVDSEFVDALKSLEAVATTRRWLI